jgi:hypothetical protein
MRLFELNPEFSALFYPNLLLPLILGEGIAHGPTHFLIQWDINKKTRLYRAFLLKINCVN